MGYRVSADGLNLRSKPEVRPGTVIAVLRLGDEVTLVADVGGGWWRVQVRFGSLSVEGYLVARYLDPAASFREPAPVSGAIRAVHMPVEQHLGSRSNAARRAYPLKEDGQPTREARDGAAAPVALTRIVDWLDVEASARYEPGASTFCNVYAYDYCYLAGVYLPRVWWTDRALQRLAGGEEVTRAYDRTLREMSANSLYDWLCDWGPDFGWSRTVDLTELQLQANRGSACVICARNRDRNRSGHISVVVPETPIITALRSGSQVTTPLQSQAGRSNHEYFARNWWKTGAFPDHGSWSAGCSAEGPGAGALASGVRSVPPFPVPQLDKSEATG